LAIAIIFRSIYYILARSFYARQDTKTPLYISFFTVGLNITLAVWFTMGLGLGAYGLAWAAAIVSIVEVCILFTILARQIKDLFDAVFIHAIGRMASATGFMAVVTYMSVTLLPLNATDQSFIASFPKFLFIVAISGLTYILLSWMLRIQEVEPIIARAKKIFFGKVKLG
jgi:putative peptidoglycan lipid II flippase